MDLSDWTTDCEPQPSPSLLEYPRSGVLLNLERRTRPCSTLVPLTFGIVAVSLSLFAPSHPLHPALHPLLYLSLPPSPHTPSSPHPPLATPASCNDDVMGSIHQRTRVAQRHHLLPTHPPLHTLSPPLHTNSSPLLPPLYPPVPPILSPLSTRRPHRGGKCGLRGRG